MVDTGMTTEKVFSVAVGLKASGTEKKDFSREGELRHQLAERLRAMPGVVSVSEAHQVPLSGGMGNVAVSLAGQPSDRPFEARFNFVSAEYFDTLSIPLLRGHGFTAEEVIATAHVVVVSEATARRYFPGGDPLGKHIGIAASQSGDDVQDKSAYVYEQFEVIGVARDARSRWVWDKDETFLYVPLVPGSAFGQYLIVRTEGDPTNVMSTVRSLAATTDPLLRVSVQRVDESLAYQMAPFRAIAWLSGALGLLALILASVGLYGVMSFVVTQRTREIGIRVALGAQQVDVVRMFIRQGLRLTFIGMVCGIAGGVLISRLLRAVLIDISQFDPLAFVSVSIFLTVVALLAIFVPARRATKVDPLVALHYE